MKATALIAAALLAGCCTTPKPVVIEVPVPCHLPAIERPVLDEFDGMPATAAIDDQLLVLLEERGRAAGYIGKLEAAATACQ